MIRLSVILIVFIVGCAGLCAQGMYQFTSERLIDVQDLEGYSAQELLIMRNEIFARHGFVFQSPDLKDYFENQSWYSGTSRDVSSLLTSVEKKNIEKIKFVEGKLKRNSTKQNENKGLYEIASKQLLTVADIENLSKFDLKVMRNEIFARHGYIFTTEEMRIYFGSQPWYKGTVRDVSSRLTAIEKRNIELIKQMESLKD